MSGCFSYKCSAKPPTPLLFPTFWDIPVALIPEGFLRLHDSRRDRCPRTPWCRRCTAQLPGTPRWTLWHGSQGRLDGLWCHFHLCFHEFLLGSAFLLHSCSLAAFPTPCSPGNPFLQCVSGDADAVTPQVFPLLSVTQSRFSFFSSFSCDNPVLGQPWLPSIPEACLLLRRDKGNLESGVKGL